MTSLNQRTCYLQSPNFALYYPVSKRFYSTDWTPSSKLILNSTDESITFTEDKSVLKLPALKLMRPSESYDYSSLSLDVFKILLSGKERFDESVVKTFDSFDKFVNSGNPGFYRLYVYFYVNGEIKLKDALIQVYTHEDDKSLSLGFGRIGYAEIFACSVHKEEGDSSKFEDYNAILAWEFSTELIKRLSEIMKEKISSEILNFDEDILLVITKYEPSVTGLLKGGFETLKGKLKAPLKSFNSKRFYST